MREETKYIVVHCSQTRPSQDIGAKDIEMAQRKRVVKNWLWKSNQERRNN